MCACRGAPCSPACKSLHSPQAKRGAGWVTTNNNCKRVIRKHAHQLAPCAQRCSLVLLLGVIWVARRLHQIPTNAKTRRGRCKTVRQQVQGIAGQQIRQPRLCDAAMRSATAFAVRGSRAVLQPLHAPPARIRTRAAPTAAVALPHPWSAGCRHAEARKGRAVGAQLRRGPTRCRGTHGNRAASGALVRQPAPASPCWQSCPQTADTHARRAGGFTHWHTRAATARRRARTHNAISRPFRDLHSWMMSSSSRSSSSVYSSLSRIC